MLAREWRIQCLAHANSAVLLQRVRDALLVRRQYGDAVMQRVKVALDMRSPPFTEVCGGGENCNKPQSQINIILI